MISGNAVARLSMDLVLFAPYGARSLFELGFSYDTAKTLNCDFRCVGMHRMAIVSWPTPSP